MVKVCMSALIRRRRHGAVDTATCLTRFGGNDSLSPPGPIIRRHWPIPGADHATGQR